MNETGPVLGTSKARAARIANSPLQLAGRHHGAEEGRRPQGRQRVGTREL